MDYYLIQDRVVLAEQFVRHDDFSTAGLRSSDAALSRLIRSDTSVSAVAVSSSPRTPPPLRDYEEFPSAPMLSLSPGRPLPGFREQRLYRILFARMPATMAEGGTLAEDGDVYSWTPRRIANGVVWCLDVTAHLNQGTVLGPLLERLTGQMRLRHGLIPVTTERFQ